MAEKEKPAAGTAGRGGEAGPGGGSAYPHYTTAVRDVNHQNGAGDNYLKSALALQARGLAAIPLRGKVPLGHGWQKRRLTPAELRRAFAAKGVTGVGVVCGALSGNLVILDFDGEGWQDAYEHFCASWPEFGDTVTVITGSGKRHIWLSCPDLPADFTRRSFRRRDAVIELRGNRCQCAVPPSLHPSGGRYRWAAIEAELREVAFHDLIGWLSEWGAPEGVVAGGGGQGRRLAPPLPKVIHEGERNACLTSLAGTMRRRGASEAAITAALRAEAAARCDPPLDEGEVERIAHSIAKYDPAPQDPDADQKDYGHALVLSRLFENRYRWAAHLGAWMRWDGRVWSQVPEELVAKEASDALRAEYASQAAASTDKSTIEHLAKRTQETCLYARIKGALNFFKGFDNVLTKPEAWDAHPWLLNVLNGEIDLHTGQLRPHEPAHLLTKLAPVEHDPTGGNGAWESHLERFLPDPDVRRQVQRDLGRSLVGVTGKETLSLWYGTGANGKSTTVRALQAVLGDYAAKAAPNLLVASKYERHPTEIADLAGRRLVFSIEIADGKKLAEELVKELTGGDRLKGRFMRQDFFEFDQSFTLTLIVNHKPIITGTDDGIWRRIRLIPWTYRIPDDERRPQDLVLAELVADGSAILNWLLAGLQDWQANHYWVAPTVAAATEEYRAEQDVLGGFIFDCCELKERATVEVGALYDAYTEWAEQVGEEPINKRWFGKLLRERGLSQKREAGGARTRKWVGIRLL